MAALESLSDSQRAVLALLLVQGRSYDDLAVLLRIDPAGVRERAHGAIAALARAPVGIDDDHRRELADHLLGQQSASQRAATIEYLGGSAAGRSWARAVARTLAPLGGDALPTIPAEPAASAATDGGAERRRSVQLGNRVLAAGVGVVALIVIVVLVSTGDQDAGGDSAVATTTTTSPPAPATPILLQAQMRRAASGGSRAAGLAGIGADSRSRTLNIAMRALGLRPSPPSGEAYAIWLYSSPSQSYLVGFPQTLVKRDGRLETALAIAPDSETVRQALARFREVLLTRERATKPKRPGSIVLRGTLREVAAGGTAVADPAPTAPDGG